MDAIEEATWALKEASKFAMPGELHARRLEKDAVSLYLFLASGW